MILVLLWGKDALSSKVKEDNCWSEQSPEKSTIRVFFAARYMYMLFQQARIAQRAQDGNYQYHM